MIEPFMQRTLSASVQTEAAGQAVLAAVTAAEIFATATPAQAQGFYQAVGRRLAGLVDLSDVIDIDALNLRLNQFWAGLGWGELTLRMAEDGVGIRHVGMPEQLAGDVAGHWLDMAPALLEGAYDAWFRALGSEETLQTELLGWGDGVAELRHGR